MILYKQLKTLFLLLVLTLSVNSFGQTSKESCTKTVPCSTLDYAQSLIEKGTICEQQRKNDSTIIHEQKETIRRNEQTIADRDKTIIRQNLQITALEDKVQKRGRQRFTWSAIATILTKLSTLIK